MSMGRMGQHQGEFWIATDAIKTPGHPFFRKLNDVIMKHHFDERVEELCRPHYAASSGRPSIPPGRYFRMLMIGDFDGDGNIDLAIQRFFTLGAPATTNVLWGNGA
ncbi:MAG: hypothetical protein EXS14_01525 [Planctomycetes bacterium]|nr:hypothetical protein [Planctomycetota bacterium]